MRIVIIGGHITPALAMMEALKKLDPSIEFAFIGRKHTREGDTALSAEYLMMKEKGIPSYALTTGRLQRTFTRYTIPSLLKVPIGFAQSLQFLREIKPDVICSFGGYPAVPVVMAGRVLGIPSITHEQTLIPGLANKIISRFVKIIALSFEDTKKYYTGLNTVVTGNPIRSEVALPQGKLALEKNGLPVVYITGGNQGAHPINDLIFTILPELLQVAHVIHQTGNATFFHDYDKAVALQSEHTGKHNGSYLAFDYIKSDRIGDVFSLADLVVSRAGVNTLCELLILGKKGILIPIPNHKEQEYNADFFSQSGLGVALMQERLTPERLFVLIREMLTKRITPQELEKAHSMAHPDAALLLAKLVLSMK